MVAGRSKSIIADALRGFWSNSTCLACTPFMPIRVYGGNSSLLGQLGDDPPIRDVLFYVGHDERLRVPRSHCIKGASILCFLDRAFERDTKERKTHALGSVARE